MGTTAELGFNGATTMESWKGIVMVLVVIALAIASMGPRQWSRGKGYEREKMAYHLTASMGPRQWSRGKGILGFHFLAAHGGLQWGHDNGVVERNVVTVLDRAPLPWLQWGHDNGVVEREMDQAWSIVAEEASMGPRQWSRGKDDRRAG